MQHKYSLTQQNIMTPYITHCHLLNELKTTYYYTILQDLISSYLGCLKNIQYIFGKLIGKDILRIQLSIVDDCLI